MSTIFRARADVLLFIYLHPRFFRARAGDGWRFAFRRLAAWRIWTTSCVGWSKRWRRKRLVAQVCQVMMKSMSLHCKYQLVVTFYIFL